MLSQFRFLAQCVFECNTPDLKAFGTFLLRITLPMWKSVLHQWQWNVWTLTHPEASAVYNKCLKWIEFIFRRTHFSKTWCTFKCTTKNKSKMEKQASSGHWPVTPYLYNIQKNRFFHLTDFIFSTKSVFHKKLILTAVFSYSTYDLLYTCQHIFNLHAYWQQKKTTGGSPFLKEHICHNHMQYFTIFKVYVIHTYLEGLKVIFQKYAQMSCCTANSNSSLSSACLCLVLLKETVIKVMSPKKGEAQNLTSLISQSVWMRRRSCLRRTAFKGTLIRQTSSA